MHGRRVLRKGGLEDGHPRKTIDRGTDSGLTHYRELARDREISGRRSLLG